MPFHVIVYSDPEGDLSVFEDTYQLSQERIKPNDQVIHLSLGDMVDKGADDLTVLRRFKDIQSRHETRSIAGNRDKNKIRFLQELLNCDHIENILDRNMAPHWANKAANQPLIFLQKILADTKPVHAGLIEQITAQLGNADNDIKKAYSALSLPWQRVFVAHWMLEKTMGCPHKFALRKTNLPKWSKLKAEKATDLDVAASFIEEMITPQEARRLRYRGLLGAQVLDDRHIGLMRNYLQNSQEILIIGKNIFTHGAMTSNNLLRLHNGSQFRERDTERESERTYLLNWARRYNQDYHNLLDTSIKVALDRKNPLDLTNGVATDCFNCSALPHSDTNKHCLTTGSHLSIPEPATQLNAKDAALLRRAGLVYKCHGHQPVGFCGTAVEKNGITDICADTGMSKFDLNSHQSRDHSRSAYIVLDANGAQPRHIISGYANQSQKGFPFISHIGLASSFVGCLLTIDGKSYRVSGQDQSTGEFFLLNRYANAYGFARISQADSPEAPRRLNKKQLRDLIFTQADLLDNHQLLKYTTHASMRELNQANMNTKLSTAQQQIITTASQAKYRRLQLALLGKSLYKQAIGDKTAAEQIQPPL